MNSVACMLSFLSSESEAFYQHNETTDFTERSNRTCQRADGAQWGLLPSKYTGEVGEVAVKKSQLTMF